MLAPIAADAERSRQEPKVIFMGDLVDRGPDSRGAMDLVAKALKRWPKYLRRNRCHLAQVWRNFSDPGAETEKLSDPQAPSTAEPSLQPSSTGI